MGEMQQASNKSVIISEILDPRTKIFMLEELFAEEGNEMHIRQADLYLREGEELSFYEIILRARQLREIVIGYRITNAERVVINPPAKSGRQRWSAKDVFMVIAEKE